MDGEPILDEQAFEQGDLGDGELLRVGVSGMKVPGHFQDFPNIGKALEFSQDELEVLGVISLQMEDSAVRKKGSNGPEPGFIGSPVFLLGLLGPRIRKEHVQEIDLSRSEHEGKTLGIGAEGEEVFHSEFGGFFSHPVNLFEFPVDPDEEGVRIPLGPFEADMAGIAADFDMQGDGGAGIFAGTGEKLRSPVPPMGFGIVIGQREPPESLRQVLQLAPVDILGGGVLEFRAGHRARHHVDMGDNSIAHACKAFT